MSTTTTATSLKYYIEYLEKRHGVTVNSVIPKEREENVLVAWEEMDRLRAKDTTEKRTC
jgi:hypothetical protein